MDDTGVRTKEHHIGIEKRRKKNEQQNKEKAQNKGQKMAGPEGWSPKEETLRD